jgi:putative SbcD/Mre11-related phosphoesterase
VIDIEFRDRAAYFPGWGALVLGDLHVGRDEASGVEFPLGERADLIERLAAHLDAVSPREVVFAGDVLHRFGRVSDRSEATLRSLAAACRDIGARLVLVAGNHDVLLERAWDGPIRDEYRVGDDLLVCHGHAEPDDSAALYVVGHDHPAITIEGRKRPCFLYGEGTYRGGDVLMLPAFSRLASGVEINRMRTVDFDCPLVTDADALRPVVYDEGSGDALQFPPLGRLRRLL